MILTSDVYARLLPRGTMGGGGKLSLIGTISRTHTFTSTITIFDHYHPVGILWWHKCKAFPPLVLFEMITFRHFPRIPHLVIMSKRFKLKPLLFLAKHMKYGKQRDLHDITDEWESIVLYGLDIWHLWVWLALARIQISFHFLFWTCTCRTISSSNVKWADNLIRWSYHACIMHDPIMHWIEVQQSFIIWARWIDEMRQNLYTIAHLILLCNPSIRSSTGHKALSHFQKVYLTSRLDRRSLTSASWPRCATFLIE